MAASVERSEIMFAAAMFFSITELKAAVKDINSLTKFITQVKKIANSSVQYGSPSIKTSFIKTIDTTPGSLDDLARGISGAIGFKGVLPASQKNAAPAGVYMTGDVWPKEVQKFQISAYGFSSYNSSDIMLKYGKKYYGVSLKKKNAAQAQDPTIINKVFDSVLNAGNPQTVSKTMKRGTAKNAKGAVKENQDSFALIRAEIDTAKKEYFANLVEQAISKGILDKKDIKGYSPAALRDRDKKIELLYEAKGRDTKKFPDTYINTKGWAKAPRAVWEDKTPYDVDRAGLRDPNSMRSFVNNDLGKEGNALWGKYVEIMNRDGNAALFGESLINLVLKTKMYDELTKKDIDENEFAFFLVTGIGKVSKTAVSFSPANVISLKTVLCGLSRIENKYKKSNYVVEIDANRRKASLEANKRKGAEDEESGAAKVFFKLRRGNLNILNLELRYKGKFSPQPQFFATIDHEFKELLSKECNLKV
jgi:hypothetical protein